MILGSGACTKNNPPPSINIALISKTWKLTGFTVGGTDMYSSISDCLTDNLFIYSADGKYKVDEGPTKCNSTDPQIVETATWAFIPSTNVVMITHTDGTVDGYPLTLLTATTMKVTFVAIFNGSSAELVSTYTAQ
ncbi:hypothetical protein WSM22_25810 [Cytophagales bacterium WSM2-2]|nr:hypothetical protein WSM22_25810 [Cytophagales bacterium WSM2-2]